MTTVAADAIEGVMCSDSQWNDGQEVGPARKVWRIKSALIGFAGDMKDISAARVWFAKGGPEPKGNVTALILDGANLKAWSPQDGFSALPKRYAIGTGGQAARGALEAGATCQRAVKIAMSIAAGTGGRLRVYRR